MDKPLSGLRLLIVEDEMMIMMMMEGLAMKLGSKSVSTAATVKQALDIVEGTVLDAAILYINLNGSKSFPVADKLTALGVPFVFATGYGAAGLDEPYRDHALLTKPFRRSEFAKMLKDVTVRGPEKQGAAG